MNRALRLLTLSLVSFSLMSCGEASKVPFEVQYTVTKEPTCTEKGREEGYDESGDLVGRDIPALGHSYDQGTTTKEASCEEGGEKTYTCSRCNDKRTETIEALGHLISEDYSHDESKHYKTCSRCDKHLNEENHNFQFKSSTNLNPLYYFPESYCLIDDQLMPTFGYDENGNEIMGAVNEYSCPTCNASLYKAEFITEYSYSYTKNGKTTETSVKYTYDDYKITSVSEDNGAGVKGRLFEYDWTESSLTITLYLVDSELSTNTPFKKAIMTLDGNKTTKIQNYSYSSSTSDWTESSYFEFTYDEEGKVVKAKQSYLSDYWIEVTFLAYDPYDSSWSKILTETIYDGDGNPQYTTEKTYDKEGKVLTSTWTNHENGDVKTTVYTYTYDSQGRLLSNGYYRYEYYDGDSYRYYSGTTLVKDVQINSEGIVTKETDYSNLSWYYTKIYELFSYSYTSEERISSSKTTYDYEEKYDQYDYSLAEYLKQTFSNGLLKQEYSKVDHAGAEYPYDYWSDEATTNYSYTNRNFRAKVEVSSKRHYENEDYTDDQRSEVKEYKFQEFSISKNILRSVG